MNSEEFQGTSRLIPQYQTYKRQKCFIAYTEQAPWSDDLLSACQEVLSRPEFNLEPDYARRHFDPDVPLRQKALELVANARYGIYDLSYWRDERGEWQMPRNVFIELGMAIALNRPTLLLRHASNRELELPECLKSVSRHILEFSGYTTLKRALKGELPRWVNAPPERDWWNRYCVFGGRACEYREVHPRAKQWGQKDLCCHISDGPEVDRLDFRGVVEDVLGRFSDVTYVHLDAPPVVNGHGFVLCTCCRTVRSTPFAIYRIGSRTPAETFIVIGMSIALETQFEYRIYKILLTENVQEVPSLLSGYEVVIARSDGERKARLRTFVPTVIQKIREMPWKPRPLPFIETIVPDTDRPEHRRITEALGALRELQSAILSLGISLDEVLQSILETGLRLIGANYGNLLLTEDDELVIRATTTEPRDEEIGVRLSMDHSISGLAAMMKEAVIIPDVDLEPRYVRVLRLEYMRSELAVPLLEDDHVIGVLNVESPRPNAFTEPDQDLLQTLARQAAITIRNALSPTRALPDYPVLRVEEEKHIVQLGEYDITSRIAPQDYRVLTCLYRHQGGVCTKDLLVEEAWPQDVQQGVADQAIAASIARLRRVFLQYSPSAGYIQTVRGRGYILYPEGFMTSPTPTTAPTPTPALVGPDDLYLRVDLERHTVWLGEREITGKISAQSFRVLMCLYRHQDSVCSKDLLAAELWPDEKRYVGDDERIASAIASLRRVLRRYSSPDTEYIETLKGRGYRLHSAGFKVS